MTDQFFTQTECDRCGNDLKVRTMSWFTNETICMKCSKKESKVKQQLKDAGLDPNHFEGCGYFPNVEEESKCQ